jgi:hypothetical protein
LGNAVDEEKMYLPEVIHRKHAKSIKDIVSFEQMGYTGFKTQLDEFDSFRNPATTSYLGNYVQIGIRFEE